MYGQDKVMGQGGMQGAALGSGYVGEREARQPEVMAEMERLQKTVEVLGMTAETLTNRLNPVRSQVGNTLAQGGAATPEPVMCGMASAIRGLRQRLEDTQSQLQRALNELEI